MQLTSCEQGSTAPSPVEAPPVGPVAPLTPPAAAEPAVTDAAVPHENYPADVFATEPDVGFAPGTESGAGRAIAGDEKCTMPTVRQSSSLSTGNGNGRARKRKRVVTREETDVDEGARIRVPGRRRLSEENPGEAPRTAEIPGCWLDDVPGPVKLSKSDKAPALTFVDGNPLCVRGYKGFRTVRATHGAISGCWYYEITVENYDGDGAVRCGWSTRRADVETPVGFKPFGFGLRDRTGEFVTGSRLSKYGESFSSGDVIGCKIYLPQLSNNMTERVAAAEMRFLKFKFIDNSLGKLPDEAGINLDKGYCEFFKNGKSFGIPAYFYKTSETRTKGGKPDGGMLAGKYFPAISLYQNAVVSVNFGPDFKFESPENARPFCEVAPPPEPAPSPNNAASAVGQAQGGTAEKLQKSDQVVSVDTVGLDECRARGEKDIEVNRGLEATNVEEIKSLHGNKLEGDTVSSTKDTDELNRAKAMDVDAAVHNSFPDENAEETQAVTSLPGPNL